MNNFIEASKELHRTNQHYGEASDYTKKGAMKHELTIPKAVAAAQTIQPINHILDHGCGKGGLVMSLNNDANVSGAAYGYDPAVEGFTQHPRKTYDLITSIDVLEHIGRKHIETTIAEIKQINSGFFFFCIDLLPASKTTSDGRNAHFLIAPSDWWVQQIKSHFKVVTAIEVGQMPDNTPYPIHLFGCATNSMINFNAMCEFLRNVRIANKDWIWDPERRRVYITNTKKNQKNHE